MDDQWISPLTLKWIHDWKVNWIIEIQTLSLFLIVSNYLFIKGLLRGTKTSSYSCVNYARYSTSCSGCSMVLRHTLILSMSPTQNTAHYLQLSPTALFPSLHLINYVIIRCWRIKNWIAFNWTLYDDFLSFQQFIWENYLENWSKIVLINN